MSDGTDDSMDLGGDSLENLALMTGMVNMAGHFMVCKQAYLSVGFDENQAMRMVLMMMAGILKVTVAL